MKLNILIAFTCLLVSISAFSFSGFEHLMLGDSVSYPFPTDSSGLGDQKFGNDYPYLSEIAKIRQELSYVQPVNEQFLLVRSADGKTSIKLSPGEIEALAGDYIANPISTISKPNASWDELKKRFMDAYSYLQPFENNWFWTTTVLKDPRLLRYRDHFKKSLDNFIRVIEEVKKEFPKEADQIGQIHLAMISGKNSLEKIIEQAVLSGDFFKYKELLSTNIDHFTDDAVQAYKAGHLIALQKAVQAKTLYDQGKDKEGRLLLNDAYAIETFATHFLADLFAAGHLFTPRRGLLDLSKKSPEFFSMDVGLMANAQHDEDNWLGLVVKDNAGDVWYSYGDNGLFDRRAADNAKHAISALQASVNEVWNAFKTGSYPQPENFIVDQLRPIPISSEPVTLPDGRVIKQTHNELFTEKNGQFLVRANVYDYASPDYKPILPAFMSSLNVWLKSPADKYNSSDFSTFLATGLTKKLSMKAKIKCYTKYFGSGLAGANNEGKELNEYYEGYYIPFKQLNFQKKGPTISANTKMYLFNTEVAQDIYNKCESILGSKPVNIRAKASEKSEFLNVLKERIIIDPLWLPAGVFDKHGVIYRLLGDDQDFFRDYFKK